MRLKASLIRLFILLQVCSYSALLKSQTFIEKNLWPGAGSTIIEADDHNFIITENLVSAGKFNVKKIDSSGAQIWSKQFGLVTGSNPNNVAGSMIKAMPNKYLIVGTHDPGIGGYNKVYALLIDSAGNLIWERNYSTNNSGGSCAVFDSTNNAFYLVGSAIFTDADIYLAKIDTIGLLLWEKYLDFGGNDFVNEVTMRNENSLWMVGSTDKYSNQFFSDGLIINIDSTGYINWSKYFGGNHHEDFSNIYLMDSGAIILGYTISFGAGNADAWILRTNEAGDTMWTTVYGYSTVDLPRDMTFDATRENIWVVGYSNSTSAAQRQGWVFKMDTTGNILYSNLLGGNQKELLNSTCYTHNNSLCAIGKNNYGGLLDSVYFVRLDSADIVNKIIRLDYRSNLTAFPVPSKGQVDIVMPENMNMAYPKINLYNTLVKRFLTDFEYANGSIIINLPSEEGIYLLELTVNGYKYYCKLIKT